MKTAQEILSSIEHNNDHFYNRYERADILEAMDTYAAQFKPQWVSVEKRLPDDVMRDCICYDRIKCEIVVYYFDGDRRFYNLDIDEDRTKYVTHWQPLPAPPSQPTT